MAIYHLRLKVLSRSLGRAAKPGGATRRSALAAAAYRSGERLWDAIQRRWFEYENAVIHKEILAPQSSASLFLAAKFSMPTWTAIGIEAAEDVEWVSKLSAAELKRAALHGAYSGYGYPDWLDDLVVARPRLLLPIIRNLVEGEWAASEGLNSPFLYHYGAAPGMQPMQVQRLLLETVLSGEPKTLTVFDRAIRIIRGLQLDGAQQARLMTFARHNLAQCNAPERHDWGLRYLALLLVVDVNSGIHDLIRWLAAREKEQTGSGIKIFAVLFERHDPLVTAAFSKATVSTLERLLELAYRCIRPENDAVHDGSFEPNLRDNAEEARNTILSAVIERPGPDAYQALHRASKSPVFNVRKLRFSELARGKAEKDTEFPAWTEAEVLEFENEHSAPVKTGHDLLRVTMSVLSDIQHGLDKGDVASRALLQRAVDEEEVKQWLVEQMNFRAKGRFRSFREAEVADGNMPDVIVSSTAAPCEVAIEVKHGGKDWSPKQFEAALRGQLATDYLKIEARRHGILVVSNHGTRGWRDPAKKKNIGLPPPRQGDHSAAEADRSILLLGQWRELHDLKLSRHGLLLVSALLVLLVIVIDRVE